MDNRMSIGKKCSNILKLCEEKNGIARKFFTEDLINEVIEWKDDRNRLIHALMKQSLHTEDLLGVAETGRILVKTINSKASSYNRAMDKQNNN